MAASDPGPRNWISPMCETSKRPTPVRTAMRSAMRPEYSTGMSHPPKSTIRARSARCVALSAVLRSGGDGLAVALMAVPYDSTLHARCARLHGLYLLHGADGFDVGEYGQMAEGNPCAHCSKQYREPCADDPDVVAVRRGARTGGAMPSGRDLDRQKAGDQLDPAAGHHQRSSIDGPLQHAHHPTEAGFMVVRLGWMVLADIGPQSFFYQRPQHDMAHQNRKRKTGNHSQHIH